MSVCIHMKEMYGVFQGGKWHSYEPSVSLRSDPRVTPYQLRIAAAAFIAALNMGYSDAKAYALSDAIVFKHLYTDLQYTKDFEEEISRITGE
jgi:hypothetical protein